MNEQHLGTDRSRRSDDKLIKQLFKIDDRSSEDLLGYIYTLSTYINFYNSENTLAGKWNELLNNDPVIFISYITTYSISDFDNEADLGFKEIITKWNKKIKGWTIQLTHINEDLLADKINNLIKDSVESYQDKLITISDNSEISSTQNLSQETIRIIDEYPELDKESIILQYRKAILQIQNIAREYLWEKFHLKKDHSPDNALYITFILLYKRVQDSINNIPKKHLDFYYKDVLKITNKSGSPTKGIAAFELLPTVKASVIEKGTKLTAGKLFGSSSDVLFETQRALTAYQIIPERIQTLYFNKNEKVRIGTDFPVISNTVCTELIQQDQQIKSQSGRASSVFGADEYTRISVEPDPQSTAAFGFVIGSPVLYLSEGDRSIELVFQLDAVTADKTLWMLLSQISKNKSIDMDGLFAEIFNQAFHISYTTAKGWKKIELYECTSNQSANSFTIQLSLRKSDPPVAVNSAESESFKWPSLKFDLNAEAPVYIYSFLCGVILNRIQINVRVAGMKNISAYTSMGKIALDKPFDILGVAPQKNSFIMLGHTEWFKKQLTSCSVNINWLGLPSDFGGFDTYYNGYPESYSNSSFKVQSTVLSDGDWLPEDRSLSAITDLFSTENCLSPEGYETTRLCTESSIELPAMCLPGISQDFSLSDPLIYTISSQSGFVKISLVTPDSGFGNQYYQDLFTSVAMHNARNKIQIPYPNKPFVPKADSITVTYTSSDTIEFSNVKQQTSGKDSAGYFIQYSPFGSKTLWNHPYEQVQTILQAYDSEGYLILNLKGIQPGLIVSLYFHFLTSEFSKAGAAPSVRWEYLNGNHWDVIESNNIISDGTNGFVKSGIIMIRFPDNGSAADSNSNTDPSYLIRISPEGAADCFPDLGCVLPNAVEMICTSVDESVIGKIVPAGSVTKALDKLKDVKAVIQAADSIGGTEAETDSVYYSRVSERIRHSSRAVTMWDYERLVLSQFSNIRVVKCTNLNERSVQVAQKVTVAVLSDQWSPENPQYLNVDELDAIRQYLKSKANSFVNIQVQNPKVEYLLVNCFVEFKSQDDSGVALSGLTGNYLSDINQEIIQFISPLSTHNNGIGGIGGSLVPQMLNNLIMNFPYVKSIKKLYVEHIVKEDFNSYSLGVYEGNQLISASTPCSILLSVPQNNIVVSDDEGSDTALSSFGIGSMEIGLDFIISAHNDPSVQPSGSGTPSVPVKTEQHYEHHYNSILVINKSDI